MKTETRQFLYSVKRFARYDTRVRVNNRQQARWDMRSVLAGNQSECRHSAVRGRTPEFYSICMICGVILEGPNEGLYCRGQRRGEER